MSAYPSLLLTLETSRIWVSRGWQRLSKTSARRWVWLERVPVDIANRPSIYYNVNGLDYTTTLLCFTIAMDVRICIIITEAIMPVPQPVGVCNSGECRFAYDFVMRANNE